MPALARGLYEQIITEGLEEALSELDLRFEIDRNSLHTAEAADRIAFHLSALVRNAISSLKEQDRIEVGVRLAREITDLLAGTTKRIGTNDRPIEKGQILRAVSARRPDGSTHQLEQPATPLLDTTLLTNAPGEPRMGHQIKTEIASSDRIDVLMAFVRKTGIRPLLEALKDHISAGRRIRVLTTTYTNSTELDALEALKDIGAEIRVSYDTSSTRLHAKAWLFHRDSGFSTAFIGSSNLTHSAQVSGMEWNVRLSGARNPDVIEKFSAVFESYWQNDDFRAFSRDEFEALREQKRHGDCSFLSPIELRPEPFQSRLLELIQLSRLQGHHRNLLVSATGTGKTVMAALDYQHLRKRLPRARLLFVAHRQEILKQSLATYRHALRDPSFGELWVGQHRPLKFEHVFASIQSLSAAGLSNLEKAHFDVVVIDEFHHAAAKTYQALLDHVEPHELLGLTATPERSDDEPILHWFGNRIAAELRLWDAIEQHRLVPFSYFGIADGADYRKVRWHNGRGYDTTELSNLVTGDHVLARRVIAKLIELVPNLTIMRALGFCVSVEHARFMADQFNAAGITATWISGNSKPEERTAALEALKEGKIQILFSVDLFNEGLDIPSVDTLVMLRPTDSPIVFIQQLGRGLRRCDGKQTCTVMDFVGQHRKEFKIYRRYEALLGGSRKDLEKQIAQGFPFLPSGCEMQLDRVASDIVLENLKNSVPRTFKARASELCKIAENDPFLTLARFLEQSGISLEDIYSNNRSWSDLLEDGQFPTLPAGPNEKAIRQALGRLLHIDDSQRLNEYRAFAKREKPPIVSEIQLRQRRLLHMLAAVLTESVLKEKETLQDAVDLLWEHPQVLAELVQLLDVLADRVSHIHPTLEDHPDVPLCVFARYTRREVLAAFSTSELLALPTWREGVLLLPEANVDLLAITFDKTSEHFSPTTRYRDFAINRSLLHWESQSTTRETSTTGKRYQTHERLGNMILPMARLTNGKGDRAFWLLGPASYVSHTGECPMAITWKLKHELPGDLFVKFSAAVA